MGEILKISADADWNPWCWNWNNRLQEIQIVAQFKQNPCGSVSLPEGYQKNILHSKAGQTLLILWEDSSIARFL